MVREKKEAKKRIKNTIVRNLPEKDDVRNARKSDIRGYDIVITLGKLKKDNVDDQIGDILEETNPYLYNSTEYAVDFVKYDVRIGYEAHIKLVVQKMS